MRVSSPVAAASTVSTIPPVSISIALPTSGLAGAGSRPASTDPMPQLALAPRTTRTGSTAPFPEGLARTAIPARPRTSAIQPRSGIGCRLITRSASAIHSGTLATSSAASPDGRVCSA